MDQTSPTVDAEPVAAIVVAPKPWGAWATIGFSLLVVMTFVAVQTMVVIGYVAAHAVMQSHANPQRLSQDMERMAREAGSDGLCLSLATWTCMVPCVGLVLLFAKLRRGWTAREYLALRPVPKRTLLGWLGLLLLFAAASDGLTWLLGREIVPEFMRDAYQTAYWAPLLWSALMVAAPLFEESLFRGFMVTGLLQSRLGVAGAILIPTTIWTLIHLQYDAYALAHVFAGGLLLAAARIKTGSLYPSLAMHSLLNFIATTEAMLDYWGCCG